MTIALNFNLSAVEQTLPPEINKHVEKLLISNVVKQAATLADSGNFIALKNLYADEVMVDYSSLNGETPTLKSADKLMTEWASVLPGFDVTSHKLDNINVILNERGASAIAQVVADHFVDDLYWQVSGTYLYELLKNDGQWRIIYHQFMLDDEQGTRDVFAAAINNAQVNPSDYIQQQQAQNLVKTFLISLENKDMASFAQVWSDDAVQDMPYSPAGFPKRVVGKENLMAHYAKWPDISGEAKFTDNLRFYPMRDANLVFAEYTGSVDVLSTGRLYEQTYGGLFHIEDGKINLFREYYDPSAFAHAFALNEDDSLSESK